MARDTAGGANTPPNPNTSSSVQRPRLALLVGVAGPTPVIGFPDVNGTTPAATNPV